MVPQLVVADHKRRAGSDGRGEQVDLREEPLEAGAQLAAQPPGLEVGGQVDRRRRLEVSSDVVAVAVEPLGEEAGAAVHVEGLGPLNRQVALDRRRGFGEPHRPKLGAELAEQLGRSADRGCDVGGERHRAEFGADTDAQPTQGMVEGRGERRLLRVAPERREKQQDVGGVRAIGPAWSSVGASGKTPDRSRARRSASGRP